MYSTCYPSRSGSYSRLLPLSGCVCWVMLRPTCEIFAFPPRVPFTQWKGGTCSLCQYTHKADPSILEVEFASIGTAIARGVASVFGARGQESYFATPMKN